MRLIPIFALLPLAACSSEPTPTPPGTLHLEMYNVQDIVVCMRDMGKCDIPNHPAGCAQFERKAKAAFPNVTWDEEKGWALVVQNGLLIVRASRSVQDEVLAYVTGLRSVSAK